MLHIVNGECAVRALEAAGIPGEFLSWDDLLYEGPVPIADPLHRLSEIRAKFIVDARWSSFIAAHDCFDRRDRALEASVNYDEVILWNSFELTDQLQLLQLLHWFSKHIGPAMKIRILFVEDYLAQQAVSLVRSVWGRQTKVTKNQLSIAANLWTAFCADSPLELYRLSRDPALSHELPFMEVALERLFEEFPDTRDGLSRTQRQILCALQEEPMKPAEIFDFSQSQEPRRFMGDWSFWRLLEGMAGAPKPLIESVDGRWISFISFQRDSHAGFLGHRIAMTANGRDVLAGRVDALELNGIDRWIGGVHLDGVLAPREGWRWNRLARRFSLASF